MMKRLLFCVVPFIIILLLSTTTTADASFVLPDDHPPPVKISSACVSKRRPTIIISSKKIKQQQQQALRTRNPTTNIIIYPSSSFHHYYHHSTTRLLLSNKDDNNSETTTTTPLFNISPNSIPKLIGTLLLILLAFGSLSNLITKELPMIFTGNQNADYLGAIFDTVFLGWATQTLWLQTGALVDDASPSDTMDSTSVVDLNGLECRINVDVGREQGTWMDKDWAASGGRLVLPIKVKFTNEQIDLGIPGEEGLGGRYCRRLQVLDDDQKISFVGPQGQVIVDVNDGGWATLPILNQQGGGMERKLRFFLDFPHGVQRNDVTIPKGRIFFSSACLPPTATAAVVSGGNSIESTNSNLSLIKAPSGAGVFTEGGITIKSNGGILNLWGATGDINLILGRYSVSEL